METLADRIAACRACPRLVEWRERCAREKRRAFADEEYWGRPVPGWGDPAARVVLIGLAPAAHGANRTGRMFTGDRSGDFLYRAMHEVGLASVPASRHRHDGLALTGAWVTAAVRCAPPANRPTPEERDRCLPWLTEELGLLPEARVLVCLGGFAWTAVLRHLAAAVSSLPRPRPAFGHGAVFTAGRYTVIGCFHPSQQNTFTGRLTPEMMVAILSQAVDLGLAHPPL